MMVLLQNAIDRVTLSVKFLLFVEVFELAVLAVAVASLNDNVVSLPVRAGKSKAFLFSLLAESKGFSVRLVLNFPVLASVVHDVCYHAHLL